MLKQSSKNNLQVAPAAAVELRAMSELESEWKDKVYIQLLQMVIT